MSEFTAQVQALGRVAIPKPIRDTLSIEDGDYVKVVIEKVKDCRTQKLDSYIFKVEETCEGVCFGDSKDSSKKGRQG